MARRSGNRPSRARRTGSNVRSSARRSSARSGSASRVQQHIERMRAMGAPGFRRMPGQSAGMTRGQFLRTAGIAGAGVAAAGLGLGGVAHATDGSTTTVYDTDTLETVQSAIDTYEVVQFAPGTYNNLTLDNPSGPVLNVSNNTSLVALDPNNRPVLNITNTAFPGSGFDARCVVVDAPGSNVAFKDLVINTHRGWDIYSCNELEVSGFDQTVFAGGGTGLWFGNGPITGKIDINNSKIHSGDSASVGIHGLVPGPETVNIIGNDLFGGSTYCLQLSGHTLGGSGYMTSDATIKDNKITSGCGLWCVGFGGRLDLVQNEFFIDRLPWWGMPEGVFIIDNDPENSFVNISQNTVHMIEPDGQAFCTGLYWGASYPAYNVNVTNNTVYGMCTAMIFAHNSHGCTFMKNGTSPTLG